MREEDGWRAHPSGEPAFPDDVARHWGHLGLTLRDHFAGLALTTFASDNASRSLKVSAEKLGCTEPALMATVAYLVADAMLAERAKP